MTVRVEIRAGEWSSGPVEVARSRRDRRHGLRDARRSSGLALTARSVHTFGMHRPISVIACDRNGRVLRAERLRPRRVFFAPGAALIIETFEPGLPKVGATVEVSLRKNGQRATGDSQPATGNR